MRQDTWKRYEKPDQKLVPCRSVDAEGSQLHVFGSVNVTLNQEGEKFELCVVVIYPLTLEAIVGLDILSKCTDDLSQQYLITGMGIMLSALTAKLKRSSGNVILTGWKQ